LTSYAGHLRSIRPQPKNKR
jgi:hypothetical protein